MNLKEDDIVMCNVDRIEGTTIFLTIENEGNGTMVVSEVAAGRIRNLREYVVPNKKIVCKILKITKDQVELSLRRVTGKEREELMDRYKKEKTLASMLKTIIKEPEKILAKIKEKYDLKDFLDIVKENKELLNDLMSKEEAEKFSKILTEKKDKAKEARRTIIVKTDSQAGIYDIKDVLSPKEVSIRYLGSSQFLIAATGKDFKEANIKLNTSIEVMQQKAKEKKVHFEIKEK